MDGNVVVTLIRHGLTEANRQKRYIGWTDEALCEEGKKALEKSHYPKAPDLVIASDLQRAAETAGIIYPKQKFVALKELREMNFGDWEQKTYSELKGDARYQSWLRDMLHLEVPNGESYPTFSERVKRGWEKTVTYFFDETISHIAMITHDGVIREILYRYGPEGSSYWQWRLDHGAYCSLTGKRTDVRRGKRCMLLSAERSTEKENG